MKKLYTLPISVQAVDRFFEKSVFEDDKTVHLQKVADPFIFLFVLAQDYLQITQLRFRGNLTNISLQRAVEVIDDLDVLLPKETPESVAEIKKRLLEMIEANESIDLNAETFNSLLPQLREEARFWTDQGFAEFFNTAFEYELTMSQENLDQLRIELAKVAHQDPQADYESILKTKRATDLEIDTDIYFRSHHNGKNDPASLLLGHIGANRFKAFEPLTEGERALLERLFIRRFPKSGLLQETDTESLGRHFQSNARSINALKSKIEGKVRPHLGKDLFTLDTHNNITFPHTCTCMHVSIREKQQRQQQF